MDREVDKEVDRDIWGGSSVVCIYKEDMAWGNRSPLWYALRDLQ